MKYRKPVTAAPVLRRAGCLLLLLWVGLSDVAVHAQDRLDRLAGSSVIPFSNSAPKGESERLAVETVQEGDSSRQQKREAIEQLPLQNLDAKTRAKVEKIMDSLSLYRRLPTLRVDVEQRVHDYFSGNPEVAVSIWRAMKISRVQLKRINATDFETDTQDGTRGTVSILHRTDTSQLVLCEGQFQSPALPKPIQAIALMHLQTKFESDREGIGSAAHSVDLFVSFPSQAVETVAKIVSPVSNRIADRNFEEISLFLEMMQGVMSRQPGWVEQTASRMEGIPASSKESLLKMTAAVYVDAQKRQLQQSGEAVSVEAIRPPVRTASQTQKK